MMLQWPGNKTFIQFRLILSCMVWTWAGRAPAETRALYDLRRDSSHRTAVVAQHLTPEETLPVESFYLSAECWVCGLQSSAPSVLEVS